MIVHHTRRATRLAALARLVSQAADRAADAGDYSEEIRLHWRWSRIVDAYTATP